jgi:hypothetical protein
MPWQKIELENKIDYKKLCDFLLNHHSETYSTQETIELLLQFDYSINELLQLDFDVDDINFVMQLLEDDYNTTK